ncbi:hypothetical protein [Changpingibacter yushuensis]|uniref:hypothetical protein n=1 Tax=Changpingibacter yushuensis TaxID=2758440 RepID=UPI0015F49B48|nr:hypothetical protein [Changpingibacter yushuensis]
MTKVSFISEYNDVAPQEREFSYYYLGRHTPKAFEWVNIAHFSTRTYSAKHMEETGEDNASQFNGIVDAAVQERIDRRVRQLTEQGYEERVIDMDGGTEPNVYDLYAYDPDGRPFLEDSVTIYPDDFKAEVLYNSSDKDGRENRFSPFVGALTEEGELLNIPAAEGGRFHDIVDILDRYGQAPVWRMACPCGISIPDIPHYELSPALDKLAEQGQKRISISTLLRIIELMKEW